MLQHQSGPNHYLGNQAMTEREFNRKRSKEAIKARADSPVKYCAKCNQAKDKIQFAKLPSGRLRSYCRPCKAQDSREYRARNPEVSAQSSKNWAKNNAKKRLDKNKEWLQANKEWAAERLRIWTEKNRDRIKENYRNRKKTPSYRINRSISSRIYLVLKGKDGRKTKDLIGYTAEDLMAHLQRQFVVGMSWDNYGQWHVDHIQPLASFTFTGPDDPEIKRAWGLPNLRPLWAEDNLKKKDSITHLI